MLSSVLLFLNIGTPELILIMFVALLLFGGEKLPGLARGLGKGIRDFKDASEGVKREINNQINSYEDKKEASTITPHTEVEDTHEATEAESRPLIDTSPVAGTAAIGDHAVTEHHEATDHEAASHTGSGASGINLAKADEPANTH
ncbi:MAG: twin-arginine translocase TatA/TatE family subunit [Bacteroidota bacterium]